MVHSSGEYGRIVHDPLFAPSHAWAFRTTFSAAGSYRGEMPFSSRYFSGDEIVRGLRPGELGPEALTTKSTASRATMYSVAPAGANLVGGATAEYRVPLRGGTEVAGFFDLGSGRLLPNWLGPTKPLLLSSTNGVLHGSTGVELRWNVPGVQAVARSGATSAREHDSPAVAHRQPTPVVERRPGPPLRREEVERAVEGSAMPG